MEQAKEENSSFFVVFVAVARFPLNRSRRSLGRSLDDDDLSVECGWTNVRCFPHRRRRPPRTTNWFHASMKREAAAASSIEGEKDGGREGIGQGGPADADSDRASDYLLWHRAKQES